MIVGVDGDVEMLARARRKTARAKVDVSFVCAYSVALPYPSGCFDRVLSSLFFHHLTWPDKQRSAAEAFRVLKPGGELHVADWALYRATKPGSVVALTK